MRNLRKECASYRVQLRDTRQELEVLRSILDGLA